MSAQHTPGPWTVAPLKRFRHFSILGPDRHKWNNSRQSVAHTGASYAANREANARLISAAPDLLEALREFVGAVDSGTTFADLSVVEAARAAIAKATGEA